MRPSSLRRGPLLLALLGSAALAACSSDPEPKRPLELGSAPAALCGGAATRDDDGTGSDGDDGTPGHGTGPSTSAGGYDGDPVGVGGHDGGGGCSGGLGGGCGEGGAPDGSGGAGGAGGSTGEGGSGGLTGEGGGGGANGAGGSGGSGGAGGSGAAGGPDDAGSQAESLGAARSAISALCAGVDLTQPTKLYLSSDDSNSMASPVIVRDQIAHGAASIDARLVRTHEFLNYYRYDFEPAPAGDVRITSQLGSCDLTNDLALQIAVQSSPSAGRPPMNVTLVLDTSGSMDGEPMELQRAAVRAIASTLIEGDLVSAVTWSDDQTPILEGHVVAGPDDAVLLALADGLEADGGTNLDAGLRVGYQLAEQHRTPGRMHRVVLISDGQANVGVTEASIIGAAAEDRDGEGIYLVGVGVGPGIDDTLMDVVTDAGRGAYVYLDEPEEAARIFVDRFGETMLVAARDVRIELSLPPYFSIAKFYGEEYSPDPTKVRTQHLAPDDSMMLYQILRPCDPSLPSADDAYGVLVTWTDPVTGESRSAQQQTTLGALGIDDGNLSKAAAVVAYAEALKQLEALPMAGRIEALEAARATVLAVPGAGDDADLVAIVGTIDQAIANQSGGGEGF